MPGKVQSYIIGLDCHNKHNPTCCNDREEDDNVENANNVQGDVAWPCQLSIGIGIEHFGFGLEEVEY